MPKFTSDVGTHATSGEWSFENFGPDAGSNILILPNGATLPAVTHNDGQVFFVSGSGIFAITKNGVWKLEVGT